MVPTQLAARGDDRLRGAGRRPRLHPPIAEALAAVDNAAEFSRRDPHAHVENDDTATYHKFAHLRYVFFAKYLQARTLLRTVLIGQFSRYIALVRPVPYRIAAHTLLLNHGGRGSVRYGKDRTVRRTVLIPIVVLIFHHEMRSADDSSFCCRFGSIGREAVRSHGFISNSLLRVHDSFSRHRRFFFSFVLFAMTWFAI